MLYRDQKPKHIKSSLLPGLRSQSLPDPDQSGPADDLEQQGGQGLGGGGKQDPVGTGSNVLLMDILEIWEDGRVIFGNSKTTDRGSVMVVPGINDHSIIEMGDLGFLTGRAQKMYEKLRGRK